MAEQIGFYNVEAENYAAFVDKFKPKLTTDDCYTPEPVYNAIAAWVAAEYGLERDKFVRPFWPGGDYQAMEYGYEDVVVDNPPFSIVAQIVRFYCAAGVRFFIFAPALTLFTAPEQRVCYLPCGVSITYANGANVATSFITNLDTAQVRCAPDLYRAVEAANKAVQAAMVKTMPKYSYPPEVITAALCQKWAKYGVNFAVMPEECIYVDALDAQREARKTIFGGGYLLRPAAAAAAAAVAAAAAAAVAAAAAAAAVAADRGEVWELSDREKALLGMDTEERGQASLWEWEASEAEEGRRRKHDQT